MTPRDNLAEVLERFEEVTARAGRPDFRPPRRGSLTPSLVGALSVAALLALVAVAVLGSRVPGPIVPGPSGSGVANSTSDRSPVPTADGPASTLLPTPVVCPGALAEGVLVEVDGELAVAEQGVASGYPLIWPPSEYVVERRDGRLAVLDLNGTVLATEDDYVRLGGGTGDAGFVVCGTVEVVTQPATPPPSTGRPPRQTAVDCRSRRLPEPEGEVATALDLEGGLLTISYPAFNMTIDVTVEYLDPACLTARVIPPIVDEALRDALAAGGCNQFRELLRGGRIGYRGEPVPLAAISGYEARWCGSGSSDLEGAWRTLPPSPIGNAEEPTGVWTGTEFLVWGTDGLAEGAAYSPSTNTWRPLPDGPPGPAETLAAVWTGEVVIAWHGGNSGERGSADGGIYDPASDTWTPISPGPLDSAYGQGIGWSGSELFVLSPDMRAAAYDPTTDTWRDLPSPPLAAGAVEADWIGSEWLVLGFGTEPDVPAKLAAFDPNSDRWSQLAESPMTTVHEGKSGAWTGDSWLWLGWEGFHYDRAADTWSALVTSYCPIGSRTAVWTGSVVLDWSGALDPETGACLTVPPAPPLEGLGDFPAFAWTGAHLLLWGGISGPGDNTSTDGAMFSPSRSQPSPTPATPGPTEVPTGAVVDRSFEPKPGSFDEYVKDQDYTVEDTTGLVESCAVVDGGEGTGLEGDLRATSDADGILTFWWLDGVCGDRTLRLTRFGNEFELEVIEIWAPEPDGQTPPPCPAVGVYRSAHILLIE